MASLYRPTVTRWTLAGKRVPAGTPGATKQTSKAPCWWGKNIPGRTKPVRLSRSKRTAEAMLNALVTDGERGLAGLPPLSAPPDAPLAEHVEAYRRHLTDSGRTPLHVHTTLRRLRDVLARANITTLAGLAQPSRVVSAIVAIRAEKDRRPDVPLQAQWTGVEVAALLGVYPITVSRLVRRLSLPKLGPPLRYPRATVVAIRDALRGMGLSTCNMYLAACKAFAAWLVQDGRLAADPLRGVPRWEAQTDVRRKRRSLSDEEFARLMTATEAGVPMRGLTGPQRCVLYLLASVSGLRAGELDSLTPEAFSLNDAPQVQVEAAYTKNREQALQPLPASVVDALTRHLEGVEAGQPAFPGSWKREAALVLQHDLRAAGIPYRDTQGRVADFHSLRGRYVTSLARSGVHPRVAQLLARHSTMELTMAHYTHLESRDLRAAVEGLPVPRQPAEKKGRA